MDVCAVASVLGAPAGACAAVVQQPALKIEQVAAALSGLELANTSALWQPGLSGPNRTRLRVVLWLWGPAAATSQRTPRPKGTPQEAESGRHFRCVRHGTPRIQGQEQTLTE